MRADRKSDIQKRKSAGVVHNSSGWFSFFWYVPFKYDMIYRVIQIGFAAERREGRDDGLSCPQP